MAQEQDAPVFNMEALLRAVRKGAQPGDSKQQRQPPQVHWGTTQTQALPAEQERSAVQDDPPSDSSTNMVVAPRAAAPSAPAAAEAAGAGNDQMQVGPATNMPVPDGGDNAVQPGFTGIVPFPGALPGTPLMHYQDGELMNVSEFITVPSFDDKIGWAVDSVPEEATPQPGAPQEESMQDGGCAAARDKDDAERRACGFDDHCAAAEEVLV